MRDLHRNEAAELGVSCTSPHWTHCWTSTDPDETVDLTQREKNPNGRSDLEHLNTPIHGVQGFTKLREKKPRKLQYGVSFLVRLVKCYQPQITKMQGSTPWVFGSISQRSSWWRSRKKFDWGAAFCTARPAEVNAARGEDHCGGCVYRCREGKERNL